jgi:hypothetical protein
VQNILSSSSVLKNVKIKMYIITILSAVLCGSLTLRKKHTLKVLSPIFEPKKDEVTGEWRRAAS